jgi:hypothetical protein
VAEHMGFFLAVGVWGGRISPSGGLKSRFLTKPQVTLCPYIVGVYGSTEVVSYHYFIGRPLFSKGLSFGGGFDFFNTPNSFGSLTLGATYSLSPGLVYLTVGINANLVKVKR